MAYPFFYHPTWAEFRDQLARDFNVSVQVVEEDTTDGKIQLRYLQRLHSGKTKIYTLPVLFEDDERMTIPVIRCICDTLDIPKADVGLPLG